MTIEVGSPSEVGDPARGFDPMDPELFEAHRRDALAIARRLVGIREAD